MKLDWKLVFPEYFNAASDGSHEQPDQIQEENGITTNTNTEYGSFEIPNEFQSLSPPDPNPKPIEDRIREYIAGDGLKRPSVIRFKIYWRFFNGDGNLHIDLPDAAYNTGTAFAITPTRLFTARHIFRPPTAKQVFEKNPDLGYSIEDLERLIGKGSWLISDIKWCQDETGPGYKLDDIVVLLNDFLTLRSLGAEHHQLALGWGDEGQRCWVVYPEANGELQLLPGSWSWPGGDYWMGLLPGLPSTENKHSGSPAVNSRGSVLGMAMYSGMFYNSEWLLKFLLECYPKDAGDIKTEDGEPCLPSPTIYWAKVKSSMDYTRDMYFGET